MSTTPRNLINIYAAPGEVFADLKQRPTVLVPLLLITVALAVMMFYYMTHVDLAWLMDQQLTMSGQQ